MVQYNKGHIKTAQIIIAIIWLPVIPIAAVQVIRRNREDK